MALTSKATSAMLLAGLVASIALQLGQWPLAALLQGGAAGLAGLLLQELRALQSPTGRMLCGMVLLATHGWLLGLRCDFGPYGLMIISSWCSSGPAEALPAVILAKASLAPLSHLFMALFGLAGMLIAAQAVGRPLLRCCGLSLLAMPLALIAADVSLLLLLRNQPWLEAGVLMPVLMVICMTLAGWLAVLLQQVVWRDRRPREVPLV